MNKGSDRLLRQDIARFSRTFPVMGNVDEKEVVAALRDQGITTLEQLVSQALAKYREGQPTPAIWVGVEACESGLPIKHRPAKFPVTVDGVEYEPADISRFDGTPLHYLYANLPDGRPLFQATTDRNQINSARLIWSFLRPTDIVPNPPSDSHGPGWHRDPRQEGPPIPPRQPPRHSNTVQMFSDVNYEGDWFWLDKGYQYDRLSKVSRGTVLFFSGDWNDQISSISATDGLVTYFEHKNFQGSTFTVAPGNLVPNLVDFGWNDLISSVRY